VVIAIIDSGIKKDHPDLEKNFMGGENFVSKGFNSDETETGDSDDINDRLDHGTYVAGNIAANGRIKGVAPNIGFKSYRIFDSTGNTNATIVSSAIIKATDDGAKVINLSMSGYDLKGKCYWTDPKTGIKHNVGDDMAEYELYNRAIKYAIKNNVTVVTAAGNDGVDCGNAQKLTVFLNKQNGDKGFSYEGLTYEVPGSIDGVINVSATGTTDEIAKNSNYGDKFIDVTAPGGDSSKTGIINDMCLSTGINDSGYMFGEGTSIAAPKVSALAGLILCKDPSLTPEEVAKIIYKTS
jgi:subtilisin family serine protease